MLPPAASDAGLRECDRLDLRQWAARDPGNAVPWLIALARADASSDADAQREALQQLAAASRFDTRHAAAAAAVAHVRLAGESDQAAQVDLATQALLQQALLPPYQALSSRCHDRAGGDAAMAAACEHIADVMMARSDTLMARSVGASLHELATGDATRLDEVHRQAGELGRRLAVPIEADDASTCESGRRLLRHFDLVAKVGELEASKREIAERSVK
jgi:hypothetical protein